MISKISSEELFEIKLLLKESDYREETDIMEEVKFNWKVYTIRQVSRMGV